MKLIFIIILLVMNSLPAVSQKLLLTVSDVNGTGSGFDIIELDYKSLKTSLWCDKPTLINLEDFGIRPITQEFIAINTPVSLYTWKKSDTCHVSGPANIIKTPQPLFIHYGQECDAKGFLWCMGEDGLLKLNPPSNFYKFNGPMNINYNFGTTFTILSSKAYSAVSFKHPDSINKFAILEIDTSDPKIVRVVGSYDVITANIAAVLPLHISCGKDKLILSTTSGLFEVNLIDGSLKFIYNIVNDFPTAGSVQAGSCTWPYDPRDCDVFIDLDIDNSSGDLKNGYKEIVTCNTNSLRINDRDINVYSDYGTMDSITLEILNPISNSSEGLTIIDNYNINHTFNNQVYTLRPSTFATNDSFELLINSIRYNNNSCPAWIGIRNIRIITYKNNLRDTAIARLDITTPLYNAGLDHTYNFCNTDPIKQINELLDSCATNNGRWISNLIKANSIDPTTDTSQIIYYVVGDSSCGYDTSIHIINIVSLPTILLPKDTTLCLGDSITINLPPANYTWYDGDKSLVRTIKQSGTYWVQVSNQECTTRDSITITFNSLLNKNTIRNICLEDSVIIQGKYYKAGDKIEYRSPSTISCDTLITIQLNVYPRIEIKLNGSLIACPQLTTQISLPGFNHYQWSSGDTTSQVNLNAGIYDLKLTDQYGCIYDTSITISESPLISYDLNAIDPTCSDSLGSIEIKNFNGGTGKLSYILNGQNINKSTITNLIPGQYIITVIDSLGCLLSDTTIINPSTPFIVNLPIDKVEVLLNSTSGINYVIISGKLRLISFDPQDNISWKGDSIFITAVKDQDYKLIFEDENGCIIEKIIQVRIRVDDKIFYPNTFSPNGDNVNDTWEPTLGPSVQVKSLSIYDRWGNRLYYSTSDKPSWNGSTFGKECLPGVYVFRLELHSTKEIAGEITLIR